MSPSPTVTLTADQTHNDSDVMFVQMMIPHHEQAVQMSNYAQTNTTTAEVVALAAQIKAAQQPEIDQMVNWLHQWGVHDMSGMNHMSMGNDGMLSATELAGLRRAKNDDFNSLFLQGMIQHHEGAIAMAQDALDNGINPQVKSLAASIIKTQTDDIAYMQDLLNGKR